MASAAGTSPPLVLALADPDFDEAVLGAFSGYALTCVPGGFDAALVADMVDDGRTVWDVCTTDFASGVTLATAGLLEALDAAAIGRPPGPFTAGGPTPWWGAAAAVAHLVLVRDAQAAAAPRDWAAFYDSEKFRGQRAMPADLVVGLLETALLADGVLPASLYPLDAGRAFARLEKLRPRMVFWRNGAQARALMTGGAAAGLMCSHAARVLASAGRFERSAAPAVALRFLWVVPKGNPAGAAAAMRFIAATQLPDRRQAMLRRSGCGPGDGNQRAPGSVITAAEAWYVENSAWLLARWHDLVRG